MSRKLREVWDIESRKTWEGGAYVTRTRAKCFEVDRDGTEPPPIEPPPVEPPPVEPPPVEPPPETGETLFYSDWSTALGKGQQALTDGGRWDEAGGTMYLMEVIDTQDDMGSALRLTNDHHGSFGLTCRDFFDFDLRAMELHMIFRHLPAGRCGSYHYAQDPPGSRSGWWGRHGVDGAYLWSMGAQSKWPDNWIMETGEDYMFSQQTAPLPVEQWLRLRLRIEVLEKRSASEVVLRLWPEVFDLEDRLLLDASGFPMRTRPSKTLEECYEDGCAWVMEGDDVADYQFNTVGQTGADEAPLIDVAQLSLKATD